MALLTKILGDSNERFSVFACEQSEQLQTREPRTKFANSAAIILAYVLSLLMLVECVGRIAPFLDGRSTPPLLASQI